MKISGAIDFNAPVVDYARKDLPLLEADASVAEGARNHSPRRRGRTRHLLLRRRRTEAAARRYADAAFTDGARWRRTLREIMVPRVIALPAERDRAGSVRIFRALQVSRVSQWSMRNVA